MIGVFFGPFLASVLLLASPSSGVPGDALGLIDPTAALSNLEHATTAEALEALISGEAAPAAAPAGDEKTVRRAIENLASRSESTRERSREQLVEIGEGVRKRLEEVVESDPRRAEEAKKALAALDASAAGHKHDAAVLQILAMRSAVAQDLKALAPAIRRAATSGGVFVRLAARDALTRLGESDLPAAPDLAAAVTSRAVLALPANTTIATLMRLDMPEPGAPEVLTISSLLHTVADSMPEGFPKEDITGEIDTANTALLDFVRSFGNIRPLRVMLANAGEIDDAGAGLAIVFQGLYDRAALTRGLDESAMWFGSETAGHKVWQSPFARILLLGDHDVLVLPSVASMRFPLDDYLAAYAAGKDTLAGSGRMTKFARTLDTPFNLRALALADGLLPAEAWGEMRQEGVSDDVVSALEDMKELEITILPAGDAEGAEDADAVELTRIRFEAVFGKSKSATALTAFLRSTIDEGIAQLESVAKQQELEILDRLLVIMKAIKVAGEGKRGIVRLELKPLTIAEVYSFIGTSRLGVRSGF